ncbi:hypothetical protein IMW82_14560 [Rhodanobacter sp. B2A1Ga4]|uniref:hypothetical protein n=1 Tax=Rhodanobacter sp. B2A1Ga4 TaxID=2778647 RepID=UPI001B39CC17|nr:hypothetical protein [Rhodanobacter sp. B2A1Ga4]MBQ4855889.1 hypothetical protein [Rhodanobacter sp. B2A1Ga4]
MDTPPPTYLRHWNGLPEAVAACPPSRSHAALEACLRRMPGLEDACVAASHGDRWLQRRKVYRPDGTLVAEDHETWLAAQVEADGGKACSTWLRLKDAGFRVTRCDITDLFIVAGSNEDPAKFLQGEISVETEALERELIDLHPWRQPSSLEDLLEQYGPALSADQQVAVRPPAYRLKRFIDVSAWLSVADALEDVRREAFRERRYRVTSSEEPGSGTIKTADEIFPGWDRVAPKHRRYFRDWQRSSAGGSRLCDHWILDLSDWTDSHGVRTLTLIPQWAFNRSLAKVEAAKGSDYEFYGRLQKLDRRVGVPFAWFFYALHGNRVESDAIVRVIRAAEAGTIVLPEHDYRVLKDWEASPYGF